jgi:uncharacterized protein (TIGR00369 family)
MPVAAELLTDAGTLRVGAIAAFVDVLAAAAAVRAAHPDWTTTSHLSVHSIRPVREGRITACAELVRCGRRAIVVTADVADARSGDPVASTTVSFSRLQLDRRVVAFDADAEHERIDFTRRDGPVGATLLERIGVRPRGTAPGELEIDVTDFVRNSMGAVQGGVLAALAEAAAESALRAGTGVPLVVADLAIHYLELGRTGPIRTRAQVLRRGAGHAVARVEITDGETPERRLCLATATAASAGSPPNES